MKRKVKPYKCRNCGGNDFFVYTRNTGHLVRYCKPCKNKNYRVWYSSNRLESRRKRRLYERRNPEQITKWRRKAMLKFQYGLSISEFDSLLKTQRMRCEICKKKTSGNKRSKHLHVDHNHKTGEIRGLLCSKCNTAIGLLNEDFKTLERATTYLRRS